MRSVCHRSGAVPETKNRTRSPLKWPRWHTPGPNRASLSRIRARRRQDRHRSSGGYCRSGCSPEQALRRMLRHSRPRHLCEARRSRARPIRRGMGGEEGSPRLWHSHRRAAAPRGHPRGQTAAGSGDQS